MIERLKKRAEFVAASKGRRFSGPCFTLQAIKRGRVGTPDDAAQSEEPRLGFTVTKKTGNSVERNRIRRRLKGALAASASELGENDLVKPLHDYVLVARRAAISAPFSNLVAELTSAFAGVHRARSSAKAPANIAEASLNTAKTDVRDGQAR